MTTEQALALAALLAIVQGVIGWFLNHSLDTRLSEHEARFAYLHKIRVRTLDKVYKKTVELMDLFKMFAMYEELGGFNSSREIVMQKSVTIYFELLQLFKQNHPFLNRKICEKIQVFLDSTGQIFENYGHSRREINMDQGKKLIEAVRIGIRELPSILIEIENEMRTIIGNDKLPTKDQIY